MRPIYLKCLMCLVHLMQPISQTCLPHLEWPTHPLRLPAVSSFSGWPNRKTKKFWCWRRFWILSGSFRNRLCWFISTVPGLISPFFRPAAQKTGWTVSAFRNCRIWICISRSKHTKIFSGFPAAARNPSRTFWESGVRISMTAAN